jgi:hypothetical protein
MPERPLRFLALEGGVAPTVGVTADGRKRSDAVRTALFEATGDCRRVSLSPDRQADFTFAYRIGRMPRMSEILDAVTADGWEPDVVVMVRPEYAAVPDELFTIDIPVVAYVSDWNFALSRIIDHLSLYDCVLTDSVGVRVMEARGLDNVKEFRLYSAPPFYDHDASDVAARPVDVVFTANLGRTIHIDRAPWVYRLARLARRGPVVRLVTGLLGQDAAGWLARSKIVFNHSARSEFSTRCFEALAAGCVLLSERTNMEIPGRLQPGVEYVDYDEGDFEEVVLGLLADPDRLVSIAAAGQARYRATESNQVRAEELRKLLSAVSRRRTRPVGPGEQAGALRRIGARRLADIGALSPLEQAAVVSQQLWCEGSRVYPVGFPLEERHARLLGELGPGQEPIANAMANALAILYLSLRESVTEPGRLDEGAMSSLSSLVVKLYELAAVPGWLIPRVSSLTFRRLSGDLTKVASAAEELAVEVMACEDARLLEGLLLDSVVGYAPELIHREKVLANLVGLDPGAYLEALRSVTAAIVLVGQGDALAAAGEPDGAIGAWDRAARLLPNTVVSPQMRIVDTSFGIFRSAVQASDPGTAARWADICIRSAEAVTRLSVLSVEDVVVALFTCYLFKKRFQDALELYDDYAACTSCIVGGGGFRQAVDQALAVMAERASQAGLSLSPPP